MTASKSIRDISHIDANGILSVEACDKGTGKKQDIKITGASTLSSDEVDRMVAEAESFAAEDTKRREAVEVKNSADSMVYQTEKQLQELGDKVPADVADKVKEKVEELKAALAADDVEKMKAAQESLQQEVMALGQAMYQGGESAQNSSNSTGSSDDVIDAEFSSDK